MERLGRIIAAVSGMYTVESAKEIFLCRAKGRFRNTNTKFIVGDFIVFNDDEMIITETKERKSMLMRPQIANLDYALVAVSLKEPEFSSFLLNKMVMHCCLANIEPIICLTKTDLDEVSEEIEILMNDYRYNGYKIIYASKENNGGIDEIKNIIKDKTIAICGQSGVGKSSLLNKIDASFNLQTNTISKALGRGKHTTTNTSLLPFGDGYIADTPGFSSLELNYSLNEIAISFYDFQKYAQNCKFRNCLHLSEKVCGIKEAIAKKEISMIRYNDYVTIITKQGEGNR